MKGKSSQDIYQPIIYGPCLYNLDLNKQFLKSFHNYNKENMSTDY